MRPPPQTLSTYDPKHASVTGRQWGKSMMHAINYGGFRPGGVIPPVEKPVYTQEQHHAFAAAIEGLALQYPTMGNNRTTRKKIKARVVAVHFAKQGNPKAAFAQAVYGGISKHALRAVEALIYD